MKLKRTYLLPTLLLLSNPAFSLGLGYAKVNSYINQPLSASIDIKQLGQVAPEDIKVYLSSALDFQRFGIEKTYFLRKLNFRVLYDEGQQAQILVTTKKSIKEPLVDFVITVQWPEGNITRDYSLFLNPHPNIANISKPKITRNTPPRKTVTQTTKTRTSKASRIDYSYLPTQDSYGPTKDGESISMIAQRVRPDDTYSIQRIMRAIHQMNPGAFINGDIDRLKMGTVLQLPPLDRAEFKKSDYGYQPPSSASRERFAARDESQTRREDRAESEEIPVRMSDSTAMRKPAIDEQDSELRLLSTGEQQDLSVLEIENPTQEDIDRVSNELIKLTLERVKRLKEENQALKDRFELLAERMEEAVEKNARLDEQLEALQSSNQILADGGSLSESGVLPAGTQQGESDSRPGDGGALLKDVDASIDESMAIEAELGADGSSEMVSRSELDETPELSETLPAKTASKPADEQKVNEVAKVEVKTQVKTTPKKEEEGWFSSLMNTINEYFSIWYLVIIALIGAIAAGIKFILPRFKDGIMDKFPLYRKYKGDSVVGDGSELDDIDLELFETKEEPKLEKKEIPSNTIPKSPPKVEQTIEDSNIIEELEVSGAGTLSAQEDTVDDLDDIFGEPTTDNEVEPDHGSSVQSSVLPSSESQINFNDILGTPDSSDSKTDDSVDIISQSSVYFAYGKFDLAEQLIKDGLETDPDNKKYKLKLMECYAKMDNEEEFLSYLTKVSDLYSGDEEFKTKVQKLYKDRWKKELY